MTDAPVEVVGPDVGSVLAGEESEEQKTPLERLWNNIRSGNLGIFPIVIGIIFIVVFFTFKTPNHVFFTASNFNNIVVQLAGTCMLAYGVVFVLLLGEIDLSIGYLSGFAAVSVAQLQLAGTGHVFPYTIFGPPVSGLFAMAIAIAMVAVIGAAQGTVVAKVGVPSFVVTLAGYLIWQGLILQVLGIQGTIVIQDRWINYTANYTFSQRNGWIIAAVITALYGGTVAAQAIGYRRAGIPLRNPRLMMAKVAGVAIAAFGVVQICNHARFPRGLPLAGVLVLVFLVALTYLAKRTVFGRHVYAVGGNAEAARRAGINVARIRIIVFMISGIMSAVGGIILAANVNSVDLNVGGGTLLLDAISAAVIGGTSLFGGRGEVRSALLGAIVIASVANGLDTAGYKPGTIYVITGLILLFAVTLDTIARRLQAKAGRS